MRIGRSIIDLLSAISFGLLVLAGSLGCGDDDNPAGGDSPRPPEKIVTSPGDHPTISPDNQWLAFALPEGGVVKYLLRTGKADTLTTFGYEPD